MRIINKKYLLIILLIGIILTGFIVLKPSKEVQLDNVILKQEINKKTYAMYKEDSENNYVPVEGTKFPEGYVLNVNESKCIDNNGNELSGVLSYENGNVTITSGNTTYCYLYFDKTLGVEIKEKTPKGLSLDKIRGEMYRFQGQAKDENGNELVDNYICFGTSDKDTCTSDTDHYMYRIIGIEAETGRVKVIKKEALNDSYQWHTSYVEDVKLPNSIFYKAINGDDFLENTNYVPVDEEKSINWKEKISNSTWLYGDMWDNDSLGSKQVGAGLYETEFGKKETKWYIKSTKEDGGSPYVVEWEYNTIYPPGTTLYYKTVSEKWNDRVNSKVSLMYLNDYSYSVGDEAKCNDYYEEEEYAKCKLGWINLSQNDISAPNPYEWTMTRLGWWAYHSAIGGFCVTTKGSTYGWYIAGSLSVRPVFYINASEELLSGTGTITDPFIIAN